MQQIHVYYLNVDIIFLNILLNFQIYYNTEKIEITEARLTSFTCFHQ